MHCYYIPLQADENATTEMLALKDANINALLMEMKGKDRMLQSKHKVQHNFSQNSY